MRYFSDNDFTFIKGNHDIVSDFGTDHFQITNSRDRQFILNTDIMLTG